MTAAATLLALVGLAFTAGCNAETPPQHNPAIGTAPGPAAAPWLIVCTRLDDADETRLLLGLAADGRSVTRFELVTPDFLWRIPGQPETRRFAAGESDASPDLAGALRFEAQEQHLILAHEAVHARRRDGHCRTDCQTFAAGRYRLQGNAQLQS